MRTLGFFCAAYFPPRMCLLHSGIDCALNGAAAVSNDRSTTYWVDQLKAGNPQAQREVVDRCWHLVVQQARQRLGKPIVSDAEDVAISVFDSFFRRTAEGRYPELSDGNELRQLFLTITRNKALEHLRRESRQKRGGNAVRLPEREDMAVEQKHPALEAEWNDQCKWLLQCLDESLREVALLRLQGGDVKDISAQLGMPQRTVERKLSLVREVWMREADK